MKPSKYLERFKRLSDDHFVLIGDGILVEAVPVEERKTASGLVVPIGLGENARQSTRADMPKFVHVLAVGKGYYDEETKEDVPLDVKPGNIVLVGANSVRWFSDMDISDYQQYDIGLTRESEINLKFESLDEYLKTFARLAPGSQ